jgi:hypothetical protein
MRRWALVLAVLAVGACGDDDAGDAETPTTTSFIEQFGDDVDRVESIGTVDVGIDDDEQVVYLDDCELAEDLTAAGGDFGPASETTGYAVVCP